MADLNEIADIEVGNDAAEWAMAGDHVQLTVTGLNQQALRCVIQFICYAINNTCQFRSLQLWCHVK